MTRLGVTFLIRSLETGGAERQVLVLADGLARRGHAVDLAVFYGGGALERDLAGSPVTLHHLDKRGRWDVGPFFLRLVRLLRRLRPDAIYGFLGTANLLAVLARPLLRPAPAALWGVRTSDMELARYGRLPWLHFQVERRLSFLPDRVVYNSRAGRDFALSQGFSRRNAEVVPNGIDTARFAPDEAARARLRAEWEAPEDVPLVGLAARLDPVKDHETFLRAAAILVRTRPEARFVCAGDGPEPYARSL
ncbi:MAG: glycosyltransferase, partial [Desulfovibrionaceae bacterium]